MDNNNAVDFPNLYRKMINNKMEGFVKRKKEDPSFDINNAIAAFCEHLRVTDYLHFSELVSYMAADYYVMIIITNHPDKETIKWFDTLTSTHPIVEKISADLKKYFTIKQDFNVLELEHQSITSLKELSEVLKVSINELEDQIKKQHITINDNQTITFKDATNIIEQETNKIIKFLKQLFKNSSRYYELTDEEKKENKNKINEQTEERKNVLYILNPYF